MKKIWINVFYNGYIINKKIKLFYYIKYKKSTLNNINFIINFHNCKYFLNTKIGLTLFYDLLSSSL